MNSSSTAINQINKLHPTTLTNAKRLGDEGKLALGDNFNAELSHLDDGARLLTFLTALLGLALVRLDNGDTGQVVLIATALILASLLLGWHLVYILP